MSVHFVETVVHKCAQSVLQHNVIGSLSAPSGADQHQTVSDLDGVIQLLDLVDERLSTLEIHLLATDVQLVHESTVFGHRFIDSWEKIFDDVLEER